MTANRGYEFRIYPNKAQKAFLKTQFGHCRWFYNRGIEETEKHYKTTGKRLTAYELINMLPELKKEREWLKEANAQSLQQEALHLKSGYDRFFKGQGGKPTWKSKYDGHQSYSVPRQGFDIVDGKLRLAKLGSRIKMVQHREIEGKLKSVTIKKTPTDKYFASFLVEFDAEINPKPLEKETALGLDLGLVDFVITSDGEKFERHRFVKTKKKKLRKTQKNVSRTKKKSKNRTKARFKYAIVHEKIANKRKDRSHKVSRQLVEKNQIYTYCLEDLNVKGMMKNHCLAESIADVGWSAFVGMLTYKAMWSGKHILKIGRFDASSKTCNLCGFKNQTLTMKDRDWECPCCGTKHDRDINAAINIRDMAFSKQLKTTAGTAGCNAYGDPTSTYVGNDVGKPGRRSRKRGQLAVA